MKGRIATCLRVSAVALGLLLAGCASMTEPSPPCCYTGTYTMARLQNVSLVMRGGSSVSFGDVFRGFQPSTGLFATAFPFRKVDIASVVYHALAPVLPIYDANDDGWLEKPELAVLYVREAALGLGKHVDHLAVGGKPVRALVLSQADVGGLVDWVKAHKSEMTPEARAIFSDLVRVGQDKLLKGSEGPDVQPGINYLP